MDDEIAWVGIKWKHLSFLEGFAALGNVGLFRLGQVSVSCRVRWYNISWYMIFVNCCVLTTRQIEQLRRCEIIKESEVKALCAKAR